MNIMSEYASFNLQLIYKESSPQPAMLYTRFCLRIHELNELTLFVIG